MALDEYETVMVVSPHLDDAVLSCGALIADATRRRADVIVVTVFNGRPTPPVSGPAARFHARCGLVEGSAMDEREKEDDAALGLLGARTERLHLPEALYRKDPAGAPLYSTDPAVFEDPHPGDDSGTVAEFLGAQVDAVRPDLVLAPLGIGSHVDHLLAARAASRLGARVLHYEDVPYVLYDRCAGWQERFDRCERVTHTCSAGGWAAKIHAITLYTSQSQVLWYSPDTWREDLTSYAETIGAGTPAERFWNLRRR